ncbi:MAG: 2Fe-2S iron-sulfur cluster-binding protein, partial [Candidatus Hydrothermia bacterium]
MVKLYIDGKEVEVDKDATILDAAKKVGVHIPTLCYHADLSPTGACGVCV